MRVGRSGRRASSRHTACFVLLLLLAPVAGGCDGTSGAGSGLSGTYQAQDDSRDTIEFKGDRVYITFSPAPTMVGEYELDDDKVILTVSGGSGPSIVLTRRGNALEGAPFRKAFIKK